MYSLLQRANSIFAFALTVLFALLAAVAVVTPFLPSSPAAQIDVQSIEMWRYPDGVHKTEVAHARLAIDADLSTLFNWNVKQLYISIVANYETLTHGKNQVVLWDHIVRSKDDAIIKRDAIENKYQFDDIMRTFRNVTATYALHWDVMPHVGLLRSGHSTPEKGVPFPKPMN